ESGGEPEPAEHAVLDGAGLGVTPVDRDRATHTGHAVVRGLLCTGVDDLSAEGAVQGQVEVDDLIRRVGPGVRRPGADVALAGDVLVVAEVGRDGARRRSR